MDRIAQILQAQGGIQPIGGIAPYGQMQTVSAPKVAGLEVQDVAAPQPFVWGQGGQRLSMDDISRQREQAAEQLANGMDYSPIASPWQGAARFSQAIIGALGEKRADKDAMAYQAQLQGDLSGAGISPQIAQLLMDPATAGIGEAAYKATLPKQVAPHYWETNDGSLGVIGADGQPQILYKDPTPKITTIAVSNEDGTKTLVRVGPDGVPIGQTGGGGPASTLPGGGQPPATLPPDFDFGGPASNASATFR